MILHIYTVIHSLISLIWSEDSRQLRRRKDQQSPRRAEAGNCLARLSDSVLAIIKPAKVSDETSSPSPLSGSSNRWLYRFSKRSW
jgi:hypothetical protein